MFKTAILLTCAIVLSTGCTMNKSTTKPSATAKRSSHHSKTFAAAETTAPKKSPTTAPSMAQSPTVAPDHLAGAWQLAIPRTQTRTASITATDGCHLTLKAGDGLSGEYVIQGDYLLILTNDERLRPLAWRINSPDSLTVVRPPNGGIEFTGITLIRAASDSQASTD